jgi:predicted ArsR family transcriptional regulator
MAAAAPVDTRASSRRLLLDLLRSRPEPWDVAELAASTGLHPNTLRGHLQLLVDLGQVDRAVAPREGPGRPRVRYSARPTEGTDDPYRQLAGELAAGIAHQSGDEGAAHAAGRHWGRRVRARALLAPDAVVEGQTAVELASGGLAELGFDAETEPLGDRLYLTVCPFEALARENRSVCQVHLDLLNGLFDELGGTVACTSLDTFVRPDLCVAHLEHRRGGHACQKETP